MFFTAGICLIDRQKLRVDSMSSFLAQLGKAKDSYASLGNRLCLLRLGAVLAMARAVNNIFWALNT